MTADADRLLALAGEFAANLAHFEQHRAIAGLCDNDEERTRHLADADRYAAQAVQHRDRLRTALDTAGRTPIRAFPDHDNPVGVHHGYLVELRAHLGDRPILVRYSLAQALTTGTAMIAHAAAAEAHQWGTITDLLTESALLRTASPTPRDEDRS